MIEVARFDCRSQISEGERLAVRSQPELGVVEFDIEDEAGVPLSDTNVWLSPTDARRLATFLTVMASDVEGYGR